MPTLARSIILCLLVFGTGLALADDKPKETSTKKKKFQKREFAKKPLLRAWFRLDEREISEYVEQLMTDFEVKSPMTRAMKNAAKGATEAPKLQGVMVLLAKGLVPLPVQMQFASVENEKEFHRLILRAKNQLGATAKISGNGDHYTMDLDFSQGIPMFGGEDGDEAELYEFPGMDRIRDNPAIMEQLHRTIHFRLVDGIMWQGEVPEIMDMDLPTMAELQPPQNPNSFDVLAEFNLQDIPIYMKSLLFTSLNVAAKTQLQQRDNEDDISYDARRSNGDFWLELLRTAVYDIEKGKFVVRFAEGDRPIRIRLDLDARGNSNLEKVGKLVGGEKSRFASIRNRPAPMTLASTFGLPGQAKKVLLAAFALGQRELSDRYQNNDETVDAIDQLHGLIRDTIESGTGDGLLQMTGDVNTGFALIGGIRIEKPDQLRDGLDQLLSSLKETNRVERSVDEGGRRYVSLETGVVPVPGSDTETFTSSVHLTAYNSCLWFAYGGPSGKELLEESIVFTAESRSAGGRGGVRSHEPLQFTFDLSQWLAGDDDDDSNGFNQLPRKSLLNAERRFDAAISQMFSSKTFSQLEGNGGETLSRDDVDVFPNDGLERSSMLLKALEQGDGKVDLRVVVSSDGVDVEMDIGLGLANMLLARGIQFQGRAMEALMKRPVKDQTPKLDPVPSPR